MLDPYLEAVMFVLFAVVIGAVIFGGTTLAYFLDKRRSDSPNHVRGPRVHGVSKAIMTGEQTDATRDKAA